MLTNHLPHFISIFIYFQYFSSNDLWSVLLCLKLFGGCRISGSFVYSCVNCFSPLYLCPFESALILKTQVKITTLVINYWKKVLREAEVAFVVFGDVKLQLCRDVAACNLSLGWLSARFQQGSPPEHSVRGKY